MGQRQAAAGTPSHGSDRTLSRRGAEVVLSLRGFPETARIGIGRELLNCVFDGHRRSAPGDARGLHLSGAQLGHLPVRRAHRLLQSLLADPPIEPHGAPTLPVGAACMSAVFDVTRMDDEHYFPDVKRV